MWILCVVCRVCRVYRCGCVMWMVCVVCRVCVACIGEGVWRVCDVDGVCGM